MTRALLLDRDGVINIEKGYAHRIADMEFVPGIFDVCRFFQERGYHLIAVTNQSGIARGYFTEEDLEKLHRWLHNQFIEQGLELKKIYHCPHHPEHGLGIYKQHCDCRKPGPGMILRARDEFGLDLSRSILVGDKESDIQAGINAGVFLNVILCTGETSEAPTQAQLEIRSLPELLAHQELFPP